MSWLARCIATSLRIDGDDDFRQITGEIAMEEGRGEEEKGGLDINQRGVREDLSGFRETLTRQILGVASFLAPTPNHQLNRYVTDGNSTSDYSDDDYTPDSVLYSRFSAGYQSGYLGLAYMLRFRLENQIGGAVGITEESLAFASNIAHHPETWLDFPLFGEEDIDDFEMSDAQCKHIMAVERLAPRLAALRFELCPAHMRKGYFWKVYFVLLHSRLCKHDAELLSNRQIVAARAAWMQDLHKCVKPELDRFGRSSFYANESTCSQPEDSVRSSFDFAKYMSLGTFAFKPATYSATTEFQTEKHPLMSAVRQSIDNSVIQDELVIKMADKEFVAGPSYIVPVQQYDDDDDGDDWLEQYSELDGYCGCTLFFGTDKDVSFSDLEDDDDCTMP